MLPVGSNARLAAGLLAVVLGISALYVAVESLYPPLAIPSAVGAATVIIVCLMRRWQVKPPRYDQELRRLTAMVNLLPLVRESFLPFGWYAMEPEALVTLMSQIQLRRPQVIVECGSGLSTLLIGGLIKQDRLGHLYSIEEDEVWYRAISRLIEDRGLGDRVTVIHAPLEPYAIDEGHEMKWYSGDSLNRALPSLDRIGVLIVDGPKTTEDVSRFPALPYFSSLVDEETLIVLDDVDRPSEQWVLSEWQGLRSLTVEVHKRSERHQAYVRVK